LTSAHLDKRLRDSVKNRTLAGFLALLSLAVPAVTDSGTISCDVTRAVSDERAGVHSASTRSPVGR